MNLTGKQPQPKVKRPKPNKKHIEKIKSLPCITCHHHAPSEAHHCRDLPDADHNIYQHTPGAGMKSADEDSIPLCQPCHWMFHNDRGTFHTLYGRDYLWIPLARADAADLEIDF